MWVVYFIVYFITLLCVAVTHFVDGRFRRYRVFDRNLNFVFCLNFLNFTLLRPLPLLRSLIPLVKILEIHFVNSCIFLSFFFLCKLFTAIVPGNTKSSCSILLNALLTMFCLCVWPLPEWFWLEWGIFILLRSLFPSLALF